MASRNDVARLAGRRARTANIRVAGYNRRGRDLRDVIPASFFVDAGPVPPARRATEAEALNLPPFGRAVALICNALASTDWFGRRWNPTWGGFERLADQPAFLTDPYPLSTAWNYRWAAGEDLILYGNHFALNGELDWRTMRPGWVIPIAAEEVWLYEDPSRPGWYAWAIGGELFDADEIFHVSAGSRSGEIIGRGVLEQYGLALGGFDAAERYSRDTFAAGALPPAVILSKGVATQAQADTIKEKWREIVATGEPVVLPDGTEVKPIVGNALQQQLVEARTWNAQQAANIVGVPGWKLGLEGPSETYQNIESADIDFVRDSVDRWGRPLVDAVTKWLMPRGVDAEWDYRSRLRADTKTLAEVLEIRKRTEIFDEAELRAEAGYPPRPVAEPAPVASPPPSADGAEPADVEPEDD